MKSHLRFILTLILAISMTTPALAYSETFGTGTDFLDITVDIEYQPPTDNSAEIERGAEGTRVYSVTLEWETSGTITYNAGKTVYSWNDNDLKYDTEVTGKGWTVKDAKVTITAKNRSNRPVDVVCAEPNVIDGVTLTGSYDKSKMTLPSAAPDNISGVGVEKIDRAVYSVGSVDGDVSIGTTNIAGITVTVTGQ